MRSSEPVRVIRVSKQTPSLNGSLPSPTHPLKLTFYDLGGHSMGYTHRLLFYNTNNNTHFPTLVDKLKQSLTLALQHFYPLSGKLVWSPESDELRIQCGSEDDGVLFIEAATDADFQQMVSADIHDMAAYQKLAPSLDASQLPMPLAAVQVTWFGGSGSGSGVSIGLCIHHMVTDGASFCHFMKSWAEICKSGEMMVHPSFDLSAIHDPRGLAKVYLDRMRPFLPKLNIRSEGSIVTLEKRTFWLSAAKVQLLKERAMNQQGEHSSHRVSTFTVVVAQAWICTAQARRVPETEPANLVFPANVRSRLDPPLVQGYFGNCAKTGVVLAKGLELLGESGFAFAVGAIQKTVREELQEMPSVPTFINNVTSSPRFKVYDTDFGWGRPSRVDMPFSNAEGNIVLAENRDEQGGIQVSITLASPHMEEFAKLFFNDH